MKINQATNITILVTFLMIVCSTQTIANAKSRTLSRGDFNVIGDANWTSEGQYLTANKGKGYLVTKEPYTDFKITLDFYAATKSNSGIFFRCKDTKDINDKKCYEANIFDTRSDQSGRSGAITNIAPPSKVINTEGKWNTYEIIAKGDKIVIYLNKEKTVDIRDSKLTGGPIALQYIMGEIKFKNIKISRL